MKVGREWRQSDVMLCYFRSKIRVCGNRCHTLILKDKRQSENINPCPAGGGGVWTTPSGFSRIAKIRRRCAPPGFHPPYPHLFHNFCENFDPMPCEVRSPGQVKWPNYKITFQSQIIPILHLGVLIWSVNLTFHDLCRNFHKCCRKGGWSDGRKSGGATRLLRSPWKIGAMCLSTTSQHQGAGLRNG